MAIEVRPVISVAIAMEGRGYAIAATAEHWRGTKAAAMDRTAAEATTMEGRAATSESSAVKSAAAAETTASTTMEAATSAHTTTTTTTAAVADLSGETIGCIFH